MVEASANNTAGSMSSSIEVPSTQLESSKSSKKRKVATGTPEMSKKKRKHDKAQDEVLASQETVSSKKDKWKKKKDRAEAVIEEILEPQDIADIELPDAPTILAALPDGIDVEDDIHTNGVHETEQSEQVEEVDETLLSSEDLTCFYEKRLSLQLPIPAISLTTSTSSILALHLAPLLLTYFPPAEGIVLSFTDPVLSAQPRSGVNLPLKPPRSGEIPRHPPDETFARCADGFGVCWVWLTATFLVFRPQTGDELKGWTNVSSEGFVGLVSYNYFQTAVEKSRIPKSWTWSGPTRMNGNKKKSRKGKLRDEDQVNGSQDDEPVSQDISQPEDYAEDDLHKFIDADGNQVAATRKFRVVDIEMVPGHEKHKWTLQIDGSLLSEKQEQEVLAEERERFEQVQYRRSRSRTPGADADDLPIMSASVHPDHDISSP